jgi:hypothetical protein
LRSTNTDRVAAGLLMLAGAAHAALGVGAIAGLAAFEANVEEIERAVASGLYASLGVWGALMLLLGVAEVFAARAIWIASPNGWLAGQISAFCGLGGVLFTLAIFRLAAAVTIPLGFAVIYLLGRDPSRKP